jgi:hypothetical protein
MGEHWGSALFLIAVYFLPAIIAGIRQHPNDWSISLLNLLLGWTVLGWLIALIWSVSAIPARENATGGDYSEIGDMVKTSSSPTPSGAADEIAKLADLHAKGLLTDDEFRAAKAKVIGGA